MLGLLTENIPKALLPLTVVMLGFAIVAVSLLITRLIIKMIERLKLKDKTSEKSD